jgi:hypothetical protein
VSNCCEEDSKSSGIKKEEQEKPSSFVGKYLYNLGKKEAEKETARSGGCSSQKKCC